jgi:hypothetical protein
MRDGNVKVREERKKERKALTNRTVRRVRSDGKKNYKSKMK